MITEKEFKVPIYKVELQIFVYDDIIDDSKEFPELKDCYGFVKVFDEENCIHLVIPNNNMPVVIHELEHIKNSIWKLIQHTPNIEEDEPDAYLIEYLYECAEQAIEKHKKP